MNKKKLLAIALAVCLLALLTVGTLAYFTDSQTVVNQFMTATSTDPDKRLFDVDLYETDVDGDGNVYANTYKEILPGQTLQKDPTVKNAGLYDQYVRVSVTVTCASQWKAACAATGVSGIEAIYGNFNTDWVLAETTEDTTANTITFVYYLNKVLKPGETSTVFETVTIPVAFGLDQMETLKEFTLTIVADAIQSEFTGDSAQYAFANYWGK